MKNVVYTASLVSANSAERNIGMSGGLMQSATIPFMQQDQIYEALNKLSQHGDPWKKTPSYEKKSTHHLLSLVCLVPHDSILEVGCGYGVFTKELIRIAKNVTAIDVSEYAIQNAQKQAPGATYLVSSLESFTAKQKFDVIICSEVLYYIKDTNKARAALERLGTHLITSHYFLYFPSISFGSIRYERALRKYKAVQTILEWSIAERYLVKKTLRRLR